MKLYKYVLITVALSCHNKALGGEEERLRGIIRRELYKSFLEASLEVRKFNLLGLSDKDQISQLHALQERVRELCDVCKKF